MHTFIKGRGAEVPTIDPGEMVYCEDTGQEGFDTKQVNAIQVNEDNEKESDKDSEGNSMEKMPKKKVRKFISNNSDHKAPDNDLVAKTTDSGRNIRKGKKLDEDIQLESDTVGGNGNNDGNVEQPVGKLDGSEKNDMVASINSDHKAPNDNLVAKQHDSGIGSIQPFQLEMDSERKNGNNDGNNNGNVEGLVDKGKLTNSYETETDEMKKKKNQTKKKKKQKNRVTKKNEKRKKLIG